MQIILPISTIIVLFFIVVGCGNKSTTNQQQSLPQDTIAIVQSNLPKQETIQTRKGSIQNEPIIRRTPEGFPFLTNDTVTIHFERVIALLQQVCVECDSSEKIDSIRYHTLPMTKTYQSHWQEFSPESRKEDEKSTLGYLKKEEKMLLKFLKNCKNKRAGGS